MIAALALEAVALAAIAEDAAELAADGPSPTSEEQAVLARARANRAQAVHAYRSTLDPAGMEPTPTNPPVCSRCGGTWRRHVDRADARSAVSPELSFGIVRADCVVQP